MRIGFSDAEFVWTDQTDMIMAWWMGSAFFLELTSTPEVALTASLKDVYSIEYVVPVYSCVVLRY